MFRHQLAVLPAGGSELLALGIAGTEEELLGLTGADAAAKAAAAAAGTSGAAAPGAAAAAAATVGNSYVDNLGKAGIKEASGGAARARACM